MTNYKNGDRVLVHYTTPQGANIAVNGVVLSIDERGVSVDAGGTFGTLLVEHENIVKVLPEYKTTTDNLALTSP